MSSDSQATAAADAARVKMDDDLEDDNPSIATAAPSTAASDVAHRKSKLANHRKKGPSTTTTSKDGNGESNPHGGGSASTNGNGNIRKASAINGEDVNGNESANDGGSNAAPTSSASPPPAPASSSSNGKVLKRRKVNHGNLCRDEVRDAKKLKTERDHSTEEASPSSPTSPNEMATNTPEIQEIPAEDSPSGAGSNSGLQQQNQNPPMPPSRNSVAPTPGLLAPSPVSAIKRPHFNSQNLLGVPDWNSVPQQDWNPYHHPMMFSNPEAASEYDLMNEFFLDSIYNNDMFIGGNDNLFPESGFSNSNIFGSAGDSSSAENGGSSTTSAPSMNGLRAPNAMLPQAAPSPMIRPASVKPSLEKAKELYYLTAADPPRDGVPEDRMKQVLKSKHDAGLLKPFNYINGYRRLQKYMDENMQPSSKQRIQKSLERFRPKFREKTHQLTDIDLIFVEEWFERSLMEYDRVFAAMAVPACLWRRTGEIFRGNKEFAELIHVPIEQMRDGKLAIYELIAEDSAVSYWEKFGAIAFDPSQKAMLTTCYLKNPDPNAEEKLIHCCFSFTIRRDSSHIPAMIIGNFLPIP
ncbi:hypothetical protein H072_1068 [Dactylellina haptotyla CBS 200.50]|uniref:ERT1/acuK family PAS domain-containing protein n=1 Tax=Dactylellina haptotyla (strain CBS 200.50) TaxID=1284197 RepID=S8AQB0_DACHA|nr:hypothetical protein H072_1068 [Dactylellina haptotyla CBS 200.50]